MSESRENRQSLLPTSTGRLRLRINPNERVFICGQSGSGKTFLADKLLRGVRTRKLIIDVKCMFEHEGARIIDTPSDIEEAFKKHQTVIYQPSLPLDYGEINEAFDRAYHLGNTTVYNDERGGWKRPFDIDLLPAEAHAIMRGRQRNVSVWTGTQRPSRIPIPTMSEAEHFFVFRLQHGLDRKKIAEYAGDEIRHVMLPKRYFFYSGPDTQYPTMYPPINVVRKLKKNAR